MKKLLNILGIIELTTINTTLLISCKKPNNNENEGLGNKPKPEQQPINSKWKLINKNNFVDENNEKNNKWYILIAKQMQIDSFSIIKFNFSNELIWKIGEHGGHKINNRWYVYINSLYRWDNINEPNTPQIDTNTGRILDWKN